MSWVEFPFSSTFESPELRDSPEVVKPRTLYAEDPLHREYQRIEGRRDNRLSEVNIKIFAIFAMTAGDNQAAVKKQSTLFTFFKPTLT